MVWGRVIGLAVLVLFVSRAPLLGQELRGGGEIRSSDPAATGASKKIVSRLRGLIARPGRRSPFRPGSPALPLSTQ